MTPLLVSLLIAQTAAPKFPGLAAEDIATLRATKQHYYLPTWMPPGMKGNAYSEPEKDPILTSYSVQYKNGNKTFFIQSASEGIGDVFLEVDGDPIEGKYAYVRNSVFGKIEIYYSVKPNTFVVNWLETPGKSLPSFISMGGDNLEMATIKKIIASVKRV